MRMQSAKCVGKLRMGTDYSPYCGNCRRGRCAVADNITSVRRLTFFVARLAFRCNRIQILGSRKGGAGLGWQIHKMVI